VADKTGKAKDCKNIND